MRKARGSGHLRRDEFLAAAERIFAVDGHEGATIRRIAQQVGVSSTALYMHFEDKDSVLLEICARAAGALNDRLDEIAGRDLDAAERLRAMLLAHLRFGLDNPRVHQFLNGPASPDLTARRRGVMDPILSGTCERMRAAVRALAAEGRLRGSPDLTAQALQTACRGFVSARLSARADCAAGGEEGEAIAVLLDVLLHGAVAA